MKQLIILLLMIFSSFIYAQGPPITTGTPVMLGLEGSGIRTFGKYIAKEEGNIYVQPLGIPYNISAKFQVGGIFLLKNIKPKGAEKGDSGLSDIAMFTKFQLYKKDGKAKTFRILAHLKQTFPTGETFLNSKVSSDIYQSYVGIIVGKISSSLGIYGDLGYNITSDGVTDNFLYNFSVSVPLLPPQYPQKQINALIEINGNYLFEPKIHSLYFSPGLQYIPGRRILFETSFQIPAIQKNIDNNKTKYMVLLGLRFLIS